MTCKRFDFPVIFSGHDHHVVDRVVSGSRLVKPGADAEKAGETTPAYLPHLSAQCLVGFE